MSAELLWWILDASREPEKTSTGRPHQGVGAAGDGAGRAGRGGRGGAPPTAGGPSAGKAADRGSLFVFLERWVALVAGSPSDPEERRRRTFAAMALLVIVPGIAVFVARDIFARFYLSAAIGALLAALLILVPLARRNRSSVLPAARLLIPVCMAVLGREIWIGGDGGFVALWACVLPVVVFFVFGPREGWIWSSVSWLLTTGALAVAPRVDPPAFLWRFVPISLLITLLAGALEAARSRAVAELIAEKEALVEAKRQIRTLAGLLPICCVCKKIRDDQGSWHDIEGYIAERSEAAFSHGICPPCMERTYPEIFAKMRSRRQGDPGDFPDGDRKPA